MRLGFFLYRLGALGVFLTLGIFWNVSIFDHLKSGILNGPIVLFLFGFASAVGLVMLAVRLNGFEQNNRTLFYVSHGLAFLSVLWILLWCFLWLALISLKSSNAAIVIQQMAYFHLFGVSFSMAGYVSGWLAILKGERSARFLMTVGWTVSYMAWVNLYLQPELNWLWAPAVGGLLTVFGTFLMVRSMKRRVESLL